MSRHDAPSMRCYFARAPEKLVLDGSRLWQSGSSLDADSGRSAVAALYREILDRRAADFAAEALSNFLSSLSRCAGCPMASFPPGTHHLTRDEVLLLGLVAGIQHGDEMAVKACLEIMTCPARCEEVSSAAANFALTIRSLGHCLMPVPVHAIEDVLVRSRSVTIH